MAALQASRLALRPATGPNIEVGPGACAARGTREGSSATLSGNIRVSQRVSLVTENWLVPTLIASGNSELPMLNSLAVRLFGESWAVDLGGIRVPGLPIPMPWLDFSYNFG
jgi:hypothetical protein